MKKAKIILPVLEKGAIHLTDGNWANEPRKDIPREILQMCGFQEDQWFLGINEKGQQLLEWFRKK